MKIEYQNMNEDFVEKWANTAINIEGPVFESLTENIWVLPETESNLVQGECSVLGDMLTYVVDWKKVDDARTCRGTYPLWVAAKMDIETD